MPAPTTTRSASADGSGDGVQLGPDGVGVPDPAIEWWDAAWGQRRCVVVSNPGAATLTEFPVQVIVDTAVSIGGGRMDAAGDDIRFVAADGATELPYWIQYGINTAETSVWVQVDTLPVGDTTLCMYYDNPAAAAVSDHVAPFTYSTQEPLYVRVQEGGSFAFGFASYSDDNVVSVGTMTAPGAPVFTLGEGDRGVADVGEAGVVWANGPLASKGRINGSDALVPIAFLGTAFAMPSVRGVEEYSLFAPFAAATVDFFIGGAAAPDQTVTIPAGTQTVIVENKGGSNGAIIESDVPILVFFEASGGDTYAAYPATAEPLYGVPTTRRLSTSLVDGASLVEQQSDGATDAPDTVNRGIINDQGGYAGQATGIAVRLTTTQPVGVISQADQDGIESTVLLPLREFNSLFFIPDLAGGNAQYIATACATQGGVIDFGPQNEVCAGSGGAPFPGKARFTNRPQGSRIEATDGTPFMVQWEWSSTDDESNLWGPVQGRKTVLNPPTVSVGAEQAPLVASGMWTSAAFDTGGVPLYDAISWVIDALPVNADIQFQIATAATAAGPFTYVGPDGTPATFFTTSGDLIPAALDLDPFVQVKAFFTRGDSLVASPIMREVTVTYDLIPDEADLAVTKSDNVDPVTVGSDLTYTMTVENLGPRIAPNVVFDDPLPPGLTFVSATADNGSTCDATVNCALGDMAIGDIVTVTVVATVDASYIVEGNSSPISNTATASSDFVDPMPDTDSATEETTVIDETDVAVTKTDTPDPVTVGSDVTYTVTVTNNGPGSAANVVMDDPLPAGLTFVSATADNGATCDPTVNCALGDLAVNEVVTVTIVATVDATYFTDGNTSPAANGATVTTDTPDSDAGNDTATADTVITDETDIGVTKSAVPDPVTAGTDLTYTVTVTNNGPGSAANVVLDDPLPTGLTFVSATPDNGGTCDATVNCALGDLDVGDVVVVTIVATVDADYITEANGSPITNTGTVSTDTPDSDPANDAATIDTAVVESADVAIAKTDAPDPVTAGADLTYTVTVENLGPSDAQDVVVDDPLPAGLTLVSATADNGAMCDATVNCGLGDLAFGDVVVVTIIATVDATYFSDGNSSPIANTAGVSTGTPDPEAANDVATAETTVESSADLAVTKTDTPDPISVGSDLTYTVTVENLGSSDAQNVVIDDPLPAGLALVSATADNGGACDTTVNCTLGTLGVGDLVTIEIVATVNASFFIDGNTSPISNVATVTSDTADPDPGNDTATAETTVDNEADVAVTKVDDPDPVVVGSDLTYTVTVTNNGPGVAATVVLDDPLPSGLTLVERDERQRLLLRHHGELRTREPCCR